MYPVVPDANHAFDIPSEAPPWDAVLSRGRDLAGLGMLAAVSALGVIAINTPESIELVRNKIAMHGVLLEQDLPLPKTWFASDASAFRSLPWIPSLWSSNPSTATDLPGWRS